MTLRQIECGVIPLVDCAPLVVAREMGFAEEEGLDLVLRREKSWSALRDKLAMNRLSAAHMLAPAAVAISMGLGGISCKLDVLSLLSVNGDVIGVSRALAARLRDGGPPPDLNDAKATGARLLEVADRPLRIGAPFPFSMHVELLDYWLTGIGLPKADWQVRTLPPSMMAEAVAAGEIDMFCVGVPWGSQAVEAGPAELILAGCAIWRFAPEKVLAARHDWTEDNPDQARALMRAVWRAARWLSDPSARITASELLSRREYLNLPTELIDRALTGRIAVSADGREETPPGFLEFFDGAANFPWRSQALWIAGRIAARMGLDRAEAMRAARDCFRADLYRRFLGPIGADMPGASEKVEGALQRRSAVASSTGEMFLGPDCFFDGHVFDPALP